MIKKILFIGAIAVLTFACEKETIQNESTEDSTISIDWGEAKSAQYTPTVINVDGKTEEEIIDEMEVHFSLQVEEGLGVKSSFDEPSQNLTLTTEPMDPSGISEDRVLTSGSWLKCALMHLSVRLNSANLTPCQKDLSMYSQNGTWYLADGCPPN